METPLLRALPLVFASGFLDKYESQRTAAADKDWMAIYKEVKTSFQKKPRLRLRLRFLLIIGKYPVG
jgi:hypothetical protein